jgi:phage gp46-like protein
LDYKILIDGADGIMTFRKADTFMNNLYLSLMVNKGSFFQNPDFGSRLYLLSRAKNTVQTPNAAVEYAKEALQWLLDAGRITQLNVDYEMDPENINWLKLLVDATQANGKKVSFDYFVEVV